MAGRLTACYPPLNSAAPAASSATGLTKHVSG